MNRFILTRTASWWDCARFFEFGDKSNQRPMRGMVLFQLPTLHNEISNFPLTSFRLSGADPCCNLGGVISPRRRFPLACLRAFHAAGTSHVGCL